ncbi:MAG: cyclic nucleotide-binding domain-containing protein [Anaerolineales bacterium]|nr:cyclic nucleotide-binding domain-containing protein [Anaerolineales bacterium]
MLSRLDSILNIRPDERRNVYLMLAQYFFMGAAMLFAQTISMPLFLEYWDASYIPVTYIGIAIVVSSITAVFLKIAEKVSLSRWLWLTVLFIAVITLILRAGLFIAPSKWLALFLPIWTQTLINLAVLAFWTLAAEIFDVRQGKRLFGLLNAGSWLSYVVAGPFTGTFVKLLGTENLYIVIAVCLFIALFIQGIIIRNVKKPQTGSTDSTPQAQPPLSALFRNRFILLVFGLAAIWRVAYFVMDAIFYNMTSLQYPNTADSAIFIGNFFSMVGLLGFITDTFLTGRIISRYGLWAGLLTTPLALILSMSGFAGVGFLASTWTLGLFWFAVAGKFNNEGLGFTLDQSASSILYQPISDSLRPRARAIGEGIVQPAAIGIAGLLLTLLSNILNFDVLQLSLVYIVLAIGWLILSMILAGAYPKQLVEAINKRRFKREELINIEEINAEVLYKSLKSQYDGTIIYSLDLLEEMNPPDLKSELINLLGHPSSNVRLSVLEKIERLKPDEAKIELPPRIEQEELPQTRSAAVQAFSALNADDINLMLPYLNSNNSADTFGAIVGLLKYGGEQGITISREKLEKLASHSLTKNRLMAAQALRRFGSSGFEDVLEKFFDDEDANVKKEAIIASGKVKSENLYEKVLLALKNIRTRDAAAKALQASGESALSFIEKGLADETFPKAGRIKLAKVCGNIRGEKVIQLLRKYISVSDNDLRKAVLASLSECNFKVEKKSESGIQAQIKKEAADVRMLYSALREFESKEETNLLADAIRIELKHARDRIFYLCSFIFDKKAILDARRIILQKNEAKLPYAIETLDTILPRDVKNILLPLAEEMTGSEACKKIGINEKVSLRELVEKSQGWLKTCTQATMEKGNKMYSTVERVLILKSVNLFKATPDDALAELSEIISEVEVPAGKNIVIKGEPGSSMFIIVNGKVAVLDDERVVNTLGERAVFGELALLDTEPRTATIRALEDTLLFRLDQEPFYELMSDRVEVAMGTIQMLAGNLRARVKEVMELHQKIGG